MKARVTLSGPDDSLTLTITPEDDKEALILTLLAKYDDYHINFESFNNEK